MQPYQKASEQIKEQHEVPGRALQTAAKIGGSLVGGSAILNRVMPLLNSFVPSGIASKGLEKIDPRFGKFIKGAIENGSTMDEALGFIKDKVSSQEEKQEPPKENKNIIEKYSPNLHQYILDLIKNGSSPQEAGSKAKKNLDKKFQTIIKDIEKDYKSDWSSIVDSIYGQEAVIPSKAALQPQQAEPQQPLQQPQPQNNQGTGMQNLMSALQTAQQMRAKRKGI